MERNAEINSMINEIRRLSPEKRENIGRAINNLSGKILGKELGFSLVKYGRKNSFESEINTGDLILISKGNPLNSNLTGTVTEKGKKFIVIALESVPSWALKNVRIDLYANDITFRRMKENLENLTPSGQNALKLLIKKDYTHNFGDFKPIHNFKDKKLNNSQKEAISRSVSVKDFFLIHGPFGTGKTRTLVELIYQEAKDGYKVLATAESNTAVDNLLEGLFTDNHNINGPDNINSINCVRLGHPQRVSRKNIHHTLAYKVENHHLNTKIISLKESIKKIIIERDKNTKPSPGFRRGLSDTQILMNAIKRKGSRGISPNVMLSMARWIENKQKVDHAHQIIQDIENYIINDILKKSQVILCTNSSAALEYLKGIKFNIAVIDESSQATIPSILIPISKAKRFVLAGDHRQLPPTIISQKARKLEKTLFEELINYYPQKSTILNVQYRMNNFLMRFPNKEFYGGKLKTGEAVKNISLQDIIFKKQNNDIMPQKNLKKVSGAYEKLYPQFQKIQKKLDNPDIPFLFLDTSQIEKRFEKRIKDSNSIQNPLEADIVNIIIHIFLKSGFSQKEMGIISPYQDQVNLISSRTNIEVKTVDGYQGREKDIIIISTVRSNENREIGFLKDLRRLNVSLTRARRKLIIIGDTSTLKIDQTYHNLIKNAEENGCLMNIHF